MDTQTPSDRFGLTENGRVTIDGQTWVVYADECYLWAVLEDDFDFPTPHDDYSTWCETTTAASDPDLCRRIAAAAHLEGIHCAGASTWVDADTLE